MDTALQIVSLFGLTAVAFVLWIAARGAVHIARAARSLRRAAEQLDHEIAAARRSMRGPND